MGYTTPEVRMECLDEVTSEMAGQWDEFYII